MDEENEWRASPEPNPWRRNSGIGGSRFADALCAAAPVYRDPPPPEPSEWTIYCITHVATGRRYVGQTRRGLETRWGEHVRWWIPTSAPRLAEVMKADGSHAFAVGVLEKVGSLERALGAERMWIGRFDAMGPLGFNSPPGRQAAKP